MSGPLSAAFCLTKLFSTSRILQVTQQDLAVCRLVDQTPPQTLLVYEDVLNVTAVIRVEALCYHWIMDRDELDACVVWQDSLFWRRLTRSLVPVRAEGRGLSVATPNGCFVVDFPAPSAVCKLRFPETGRAAAPCTFSLYKGQGSTTYQGTRDETPQW